MSTAAERTVDPQPLLGLAAVAVSEVHPSPSNPRTRLVDLEELAVSIRENGLIQPIVVQKIPGRDGYQIVAGHRRHAAVRKLGWAKVPAIIRRDMLPDDELVTMLVENGQRAGLDPVEEARAYSRLKHQMGLSDSEVARRVGRSQAHVSLRLSLLALSPAEQEELRAGVVTIGAATAKAKVDSGRTRPTAVGKKSAQHLSIHHDLGDAAKARCSGLEHKSKGSASVGGIACGECWEAVIRADERRQIHAKSAEQGRCVTCGVEHDPDAWAGMAP